MKLKFLDLKSVQPVESIYTVGFEIQDPSLSWVRWIKF